METTEALIAELKMLEKAVFTFRIKHNFWDKVEYEGDFHKRDFYIPLLIQAVGELVNPHTNDIIKYIFENYRMDFSERDYERNKSGNYRFNNMIYSAIHHLRENGFIKELSIKNSKGESVQLTTKGKMEYSKLRSKDINKRFKMD